MLFRSLNEYYTSQDDKAPPRDTVEEDARKLESCVEIERLLEEALKSEEWPVVCDKVEDQYLPTTRAARRRKDTIALSYANRSLVPSGAPPGVKRKREEEDIPQVSGEAKRAKRVSPRLRLRKPKSKGWLTSLLQRVCR